MGSPKATGVVGAVAEHWMARRVVGASVSRHRCAVPWAGAESMVSNLAIDSTATITATPHPAVARSTAFVTPPGPSTSDIAAVAATLGPPGDEPQSNDSADERPSG